ncbi:MAG: hypothetical protein ACLVJO_03965 [[Clostridium] scindens]
MILFNELRPSSYRGRTDSLIKRLRRIRCRADSITQKVIDACDHLKVISRYGAGYDRVDTAAAKAKASRWVNTPGVNAEAVGEPTFALILAVARRILISMIPPDGEWVRSTEWN